MSTLRTVRLSPNDNVVVAVDPIPEGAQAAGDDLRQRGCHLADLEPWLRARRRHRAESNLKVIL